MKKIRLICRTVNIGAAANIGGPVDVEHRTIDVDVPDEVHAWLTANQQWITREVIGVECIP